MSRIRPVVVLVLAAILAMPAFAAKTGRYRTRVPSPRTYGLKADNWRQVRRAGVRARGWLSATKREERRGRVIAASSNDDPDERMLKLAIVVGGVMSIVATVLTDLSYQGP